ncbi:MAG: chain length determinant protein tyrosine kinase EpsG [Rhodocyclaceae bacterium]|nr:MAG: chain length determinant protein tyrosine kinase EpsG [Rhodocyclaceae bacterium]
MMQTTLQNPQRSIGAILIDAEMLSLEEAERILKLQKEENLRFGDAAIRLGLLTDEDIRFALSHQFSYTYLPLAGGRPVSEEVVAAYQPFSHLVEQLRSIRSQLLLRWFDREAEQTTLALVGAARGEGRSYLAANLAVLFSQLGERTLLVDADLRMPRQHELFKLDNKRGLSSLLAGRGDEDAIVPIKAFSSLDVLPSGPVPPNPLELLNRPQFQQFLTEAGKRYEVVLIDTTAMSQGADAAMVATHAGAVLAVGRNNVTRVSAFGEMVKSLNRNGVAVIGSVFNDPPLVKVA